MNGSTSTVDEDTFKESDVNVTLNVEVVNQTVCVKDSAEFQPVHDGVIEPAHFNEMYGDCYISGFIEGGKFSGLLSIHVSDRTDSYSKIETIKQTLISLTKSENEDFVLGPSGTDSSSVQSVLRDTETKISVCWTGGGQIKDANVGWDIDSMAILTPYKANRSFVKKFTGNPFKILRYDLIAGFTAELFDRFMDYKILLKKVQTMIGNRAGYRMRTGVVNAVDTKPSTLLSVRSALRDEQNKIAEAVEVLVKRPDILKRQAAWSNDYKSKLVQGIVKTALGDEWDWQPETANVQPPRSEGKDTGGAEKNEEGVLFNFSTLIPPEVWEDLLPEPLPAPAAKPRDLYAEFNPIDFVNPADGSNTPMSEAVVVTHSASYQDMEQQLKASKEAKTKAEQDFQRLNDEFTAFKTAADQRDKEKKARFGEQSDLAATRGGELERTRSELEATKADKARVQEQQARTQEQQARTQEQLSALASRELPGMTSDDIVILAITYADVSIYRLGDNPTRADAEVVDAVKRAMRTGTEYSVGDFAGTRPAGWDPKPGVLKSLVFVYRYNTPNTPYKGVRTWFTWDVGKARFDAFS